MEHVIYLDPEKDKQVRKLFRSISPKLRGRNFSPRKFKDKVYPKFVSYMKKKQDKIREAQRDTEQQFQKSIKKLNYSQMWSKKVTSGESRPFLQRAQQNVHLMWERQAQNEKKRAALEEDRSKECTFWPKIDGKAKSIGPRSIRDWYRWDREREAKQRQKQQMNRKREMKECRGKFRSPKTRKQIEKERAEKGE